MRLVLERICFSIAVVVQAIIFIWLLPIMLVINVIRIVLR